MTQTPLAAGGVTEVVPFLGVTDIERSLHFYVTGLGATIDREWLVDGRIRWCRLGLGGAAVMLQEFSPGGVPAGIVGTGQSLNFTCRDALALYDAAHAAGLEPLHEPQVGNGLWELGYADPDGYRINFASPPASRKSCFSQRTERLNEIRPQKQVRGQRSLPIRGRNRRFRPLCPRFIHG